jgi:hypothetical protein
MIDKSRRKERKRKKKKVRRQQEGNAWEHHLHHRHETYSVNNPPIMGPNASPNCPRPIFTPMNLACALGGSTSEMMVRAPFDMPDDPTPAMARPTMNIAED